MQSEYYASVSELQREAEETQNQLRYDVLTMSHKIIFKVAQIYSFLFGDRVNH